MADLSGVLRKTIDGLPRATPQMRAKVYEKARAAIQRQIQSADPALAPQIADARMNALEDAIHRTEEHYLAMEEAPAAPPPAPAMKDVPTPAPVSAQPYVEDDRYGDGNHGAGNHEAGNQGTSAPPHAEDQNVRHDGWGSQPEPGYPHENARAEQGHGQPDWGAPVDAGASSHAYDHDQGETSAPPSFRPTEPEAVDRGQDGSVGPFVPMDSNASETLDYQHDDHHPDERAIGRDEPDLEHQSDSRLPDETISIPAADVSAPRYTPPRRQSEKKSRGVFAVASLVVIIGGLGAAAFFYGDEISQTLLGDETLIAAGETPAEEGADGEQVAAANPDDASPETQVPGVAEPEAGAPAAGGSTRQFTQRLLADGTEVDEGPAEPEPNAFGEGTNVAAATAVEADGSPGTTPTIASEIGEDPQVIGAESGESADAATEVTPPADASEAQPGEEQQAALAPQGDPSAIPVAQRAVFYQERTQEAPGTQETGNVVWSVVEEPPIEGQPPEPAIRAVAEVPQENLTLTMTIRRNADPTLPASHVIELLFDTPAGFAGGNVATVQRLALKPTEQARGEPLIGVAGKISDGFFIVALNNLDQAVQNNLALLESEDWIDIPIGYATGRRALVSIEKGIPGERAFREAIAAWEAKT